MIKSIKPLVALKIDYAIVIDNLYCNYYLVARKHAQQNIIFEIVIKAKNFINNGGL